VRRGPRKRFDERALKIVLAAFFLALAIPAGVLIAQAYDQLNGKRFAARRSRPRSWLRESTRICA
jgi:hypothetical protein